MCHAGEPLRQPVPSGKRAEVDRLIERLHAAQRATAARIQTPREFGKLGYRVPDPGFTVNDVLRMWVWHFWTHHRDLVRARGPLTDDDPHFHVPHYVRQAYEEFGRFAGELACLSDEYLDVRPPGGGRTVRETVEHLLETLSGYVPEQIERATPGTQGRQALAAPEPGRTVRIVPPVSTHRMYDDLAYLWPLVSPAADYAREAGFWRDALRAKLGPGRHEILELGVGGGCNLSHLTADFQATAVDLSEKMLAQCRRLNPDVDLHLGDMRTVRLSRTFDAVLVHDAIGYMLTEDDLRQTFATAAAHLAPGGVFVVAPDDYRETFHPPCVEHSTHSDGETELTLIQYRYDPDPTDTVTETRMLYLIRTKGGLRVEEDRHLMGLFPLQTWLDLMREAGFVPARSPTLPYEDGREPTCWWGPAGESVGCRGRRRKMGR